MSYKCCDCGETKASRDEMECHINFEHVGWTPYQCFYCNQDGITTRKPTSSLLHDHVTQQHPNQQFTYLYTDDTNYKELFEDRMRRSIDQQSCTESIITPLSVNTENRSAVLPFLISPKEELKDEVESYSIDPNPSGSTSENRRCGTCDEFVPRNLEMIRDHVKVHFNEKTGCFPMDLSKLPPNFRQIYCSLMLSSFPESASILNNLHQQPNIIQTINHDEGERQSYDNEVSQEVQNVANRFSCGICSKKFPWKCHLRKHEDNSDHVNTLAHLAKEKCNLCHKKYHYGNGLKLHKQRLHDVQSTKKFVCKNCDQTFNQPLHLASHIRLKCSGNINHDCKKCGRKCRNITSLSYHQIWCKPKEALSHKCNLCGKRFGSVHAMRIHKHTCKRNKSVTAPKVRKTGDDSTVCDVCHKDCATKGAMHIHRTRKHGITGVQMKCNKCKFMIGTMNVMVARHILTIHMNKKVYECSLCQQLVYPSFIECHDASIHGGLGKARCIYNVDRYESEIEQKRKLLITTHSQLDDQQKESNPLPVHQKLTNKMQCLQPNKGSARKLAILSTPDSRNIQTSKRVKSKKLKLFSERCIEKVHINANLPNSLKKKTNLVPFKNRQKFITKMHSKSVNRSDAVMWLSRYQQSRKHKRTQPKRRILLQISAFPRISAAEATSAVITQTVTNVMPQVTIGLTEVINNDLSDAYDDPSKVGGLFIRSIAD